MAKTGAEMAMAKRAERVPLSNLNYDLLTVLQNKLEAVAAYETYLKDCQQSGDKECLDLVAERSRTASEPM